MPIFTSRFSPERSLLGTFLSTQSQRETGSAERRGRSESGRETDRLETDRLETDRLELSGRQTIQAGQARSAAESRTPNRPRGTSANRGPDEGSGSPPQNRPAEDVGFAQQFRLRRAAQEASAVEGPQPPPTRPQIPEPVLPAQGTASEFRLRIEQENQAAVQAAAPGRLENLLSGLAAFRNLGEAIREEGGPAQANASLVSIDAFQQAPQGSGAAPGEEGAAGPPVVLSETAAPETGDLNAGSAEPAERADENAEGQDFPALSRRASPVTPTREDQQASLREDLHTIADGLRTDAAIESRQSVQQTARSTEQATVRAQREEIRENQTEINSLQTTRRGMQQELQQTDQAIRQLQSRNSRIQNSQSTDAGTSLDILAP